MMMYVVKRGQNPVQLSDFSGCLRETLADNCENVHKSTGRGHLIPGFPADKVGKHLLDLPDDFITVSDGQELPTGNMAFLQD